jgi:hypothetical protein
MHAVLSGWPLLAISTANPDVFEVNSIISRVLLTMIVLPSCLC